MTFTDDELQGFARATVRSCIKEIDYGGIGEQHMDQWAHLPAAEYDKAQDTVADLISSATITVTWPDGAVNRTAAIERTLREFGLSEELVSLCADTIIRDLGAAADPEGANR